MYRDPILCGGTAGDKIRPAWGELGFRFGEKGTHACRTIMLPELTGLFRYCSPNSTRPDYENALLKENCLGKHTFSSRQQALQRLSELYALDPSIAIFRLLRAHWIVDEKARPQLAMLVALARDPLLRATAPVVLSTGPGEEIARQRFTEALRDAVEGRLSDATLDKVVRNTAASWTQSGHFEGRSRKRRLRLQPTTAAAVYALLLGYMLGVRGRTLFDTLFARVLDRNESDLTFLAMDAKRLGLLDIKSAGGMTVVSFNTLLNEQEKRLIHGTD
ncbi:MAG: hypothetical protein HY360_03220 [Verrucomicrobia bacterium]|nr:hypothetical protein [Verrucomicrobiota bacterium]